MLADQPFEIIGSPSFRARARQAMSAERVTANDRSDRIPIDVSITDQVLFCETLVQPSESAVDAHGVCER